jgi:hypothetical protein
MRKMFVLMVALTIISVPAFANMLVNGDFETGDLAGWTAFQSGWSSGTTTVEVQDAVVCHDAFSLHLRAANSSRCNGARRQVPDRCVLAGQQPVRVLERGAVLQR